MAEQINTETIIREYIPQVIHMSLATASDNKPRVFEVHFAYDDDLNLYFVSSISSQHSEDIRKNPHVAGSIVTQHFLNQRTRGVYFEGTAKQLEDPDEMEQAHQAYTKRYHESPQLAKAAAAEGSARLYKVSVQDFYLIDGYDSDFPQKLRLHWSA